MAFKRSAVRSRLSPPKRPEIVRFQVSFFQSCFLSTMFDLYQLPQHTCISLFIHRVFHNAEGCKQKVYDHTVAYGGSLSYNCCGTIAFVRSLAPAASRCRIAQIQRIRFAQPNCLQYSCTRCVPTAAHFMCPHPGYCCALRHTSLYCSRL